jgi:hypothetical protein
LAQDEKNLNQIYFAKVKAGKTLEFEESLKNHMAWLGQQGEKWTWAVWSRVAGEDLAVYAIGSWGHDFAELDAHGSMAMRNRQHWLETAGQYVEAISGRLVVSRPDISKPPATNAPPPMAWVIEQTFTVGSEQEFNHLAKQITEAINKTGWPVTYTWNQVIAGTSAPTMTLVIPSDNWAGLKGPAEPFEAMLEKAMGRQGAKALQDRLNTITVSESSYI